MSTSYKNRLKLTKFQTFPAQVLIFSQIRSLQVRAYAIKTKLSDKENFCHKISLKRGFVFDHDNWYIKKMERRFFPTKIEAHTELARVAFISKHHYHLQMKQFNVLNDPRWLANIEAKQSCFQLDRYRYFAFQHGNMMVYYPRDH